MYNSEKKYISFSAYISNRFFYTTFIDTHRFMSTSPEKLAINLSGDKIRFREIHRMFNSKDI